jgi:hypothetical protein
VSGAIASASLEEIPTAGLDCSKAEIAARRINRAKGQSRSVTKAKISLLLANSSAGPSKCAIAQNLDT